MNTPFLGWAKLYMSEQVLSRGKCPALKMGCIVCSLFFGYDGGVMQYGVATFQRRQVAKCCTAILFGMIEEIRDELLSV